MGVWSKYFYSIFKILLKKVCRNQIVPYICGTKANNMTTNGTHKYAITEQVYFNNFMPATYKTTKDGYIVTTRNGEKYHINLDGKITKR